MEIGAIRAQIGLFFPDFARPDGSYYVPETKVRVRVDLGLGHQKRKKVQDEHFLRSFFGRRADNITNADQQNWRLTFSTCRTIWKEN
jgi:hypothetical protein